jgi:hypothetical protein
MALCPELARELVFVNQYAIVRAGDVPLREEMSDAPHVGQRPGEQKRGQQEPPEAPTG